jgi:hypothetical protein
MDEVVAVAPWMVSARSSGEVLAVWVARSGIQLGFLGAPAGFDKAEIEGWLGDLISVTDELSRETPSAPDPSPSPPIPRRLHHALTGLLFYEAELWGGPEGRSPCALALVEDEGEVAFGWIGSARVELSVEGRVVEPRWIVVRDDQRRDARAFAADGRERLDLKAAWTSPSGEAESATAVLEAQWPGLRGEPPVVTTDVRMAPAAELEESPVSEAGMEPPESGAGPAPPPPAATSRLWRFRSWMDKLAGPRNREEETATQALPVEPIAHDVPGVPDLIPVPESVEVEREARTAPATNALEIETAVAEPLAEEPIEAKMVITESATAGPDELGATTVERSAEAPVEAEMAIGEGATAGPDELSAPAVEPQPEATVEAEMVTTESETAGPVGATSTAEQREAEPDAREVRSADAAAPGPGPAETPLGLPARPIDPYDLGFAPPTEHSLEVEPIAADEAAPSVAEPAVVEGPAAEEPESAVEPVTAGPADADAPGPPTEFGAIESVSSVERGSLLEAVASAETAPATRRAGVRRPAWPEPDETAQPSGRALWKQPWFVAVAVVALFLGGWLVGRLDFAAGSKGLASMLKAAGFGPARYEEAVTSRPSGAWIKVDGADRALRTPATLQLKPGAHQVVLTLSGVGGSSHTVQGKRGERVALDVELWGGLAIIVPGGSVPIEVTVDGMPRGYAPLTVDRLSPGIHRLQFSGPGIAPWEQAVEVHVNRTVEVVAQPIASPSTGMLEVRATLADEAGSEPLSGATVWIDGEQRGSTPLRLELARGPHSIRGRYRDEEAPVLVLDLPGGNERFATLQFGLNETRPRLQAALAGLVPLDRPTVVSASLDRAREGDVREIWLHVRTPEGAWRRYPMSVMKAAGGIAGVAVFPTVLFDPRGRAAWYVSALTPMGDEYFTEIQTALAAPAP